MKFLLITDYLDFIGGGFEPLGILYVLSAVRAAGHEVRLVESDYDKASKVFEEWKPDVAGYGVYTGYHKPLIELNRRLKKKYNFISVFGGPHPTFFPEMIDLEGVDAIVRGEGEEAIVDFINTIQRDDDYTKVKNFWVKNNGSVYENEVRPLQHSLDDIAFPARDLFYEFPDARKNKIRVVVTARGCPYACTYCYNYKIKELYKDFPGQHLRHRSVDSVIEEITWIRDNYPIEFIYFGTDNFTTRKDWILEFAEKYGQKLKIPFMCSTRPESAKSDIFNALKKAGCQSVYMGVESGDEPLRRNLLNRKMSDQTIIQAANYIHEAGLKLATFNMMCYPGETVEQALKTMYINQKCKTDFTWVAIFQPYPRTKLAEYAAEQGVFDGDYDNLPTSWYRESNLSNPEKKQLERLEKLVSLGVEFPWLTPLVKLGMHLPFASFYLFLMKMHKAYAYRFRILPVKLGFKEVVRLGWKFLFDRSA